MFNQRDIILSPSHGPGSHIHGDNKKLTWAMSNLCHYLTCVKRTLMLSTSWPGSTASKACTPIKSSLTLGRSALLPSGFCETRLEYIRGHSILNKKLLYRSPVVPMVQAGGGHL